MPQPNALALATEAGLAAAREGTPTSFIIHDCEMAEPWAARFGTDVCFVTFGDGSIATGIYLGHMESGWCGFDSRVDAERYLTAKAKEWMSEQERP